MIMYNKSGLKTAVKVCIPLIFALISIFVIAERTTSQEYHAKTIASLDEKRVTVMELAGASTAASLAVSMIPGDTATPIAQKLADLTTYFLVALCAIYLEKYLLAITGYAAFKLLIPIACALIAGNVFLKSEGLKNLSIKLITFGLAMFMVIPTSVKVSTLIEDTYHDSIQSTIAATNETVREIESSTSEASEDVEETDTWWGKIVDSVKNAAASAKDIILSVPTLTKELRSKAENALNNLIEALAVMLVTSCVIPLAVLGFFMWLVKVILGININFAKAGRSLRNVHVVNIRSKNKCEAKE